jgi:anti-sigma B factor antagonist
VRVNTISRTCDLARTRGLADGDRGRLRWGLNVEIEIRSLGEVKLIKLTGKITLGAAVDRLRENLDELMDNGTSRFILELAEVPMIDSSGIGLLVRYMTAAKQRGGAVKLLNPSKFTVQTLKMIGLLNLFEVFQVQDEAVASFG